MTVFTQVAPKISESYFTSIKTQPIANNIVRYFTLFGSFEIISTKPFNFFFSGKIETNDKGFLNVKIYTFAMNYQHVRNNNHFNLKLDYTDNFQEIKIA